MFQMFYQTNEEPFRICLLLINICLSNNICPNKTEQFYYKIFRIFYQTNE